MTISLRISIKALKLKEEKKLKLCIYLSSFLLPLIAFLRYSPIIIRPKLLNARKYFCSLPAGNPSISTKYSALGQIEDLEDISLLAFEINNSNIKVLIVFNV